MFSRRTDIATGSEQFDARAHMSPGVFRQVREKTTLGFFTGTVPLDKPAGKQGPKDLPLLSPILGNLLGSGERSSEEIMTIVNSLVLQFFNCYVKGEGVFTAQEIY